MDIKKSDALPVGQLVIKREKNMTFFFAMRDAVAKILYEYE